jgi:co-chaperonin GroES (HSP10)
MKQNIQPIGDRLIIKAIPKEASSLILAGKDDESWKYEEYQEVVAIGTGRTENGIHIPIPLAVGDLVLCPIPNRPYKIKDEDLPHFIVNLHEIYAIKKP